MRIAEKINTVRADIARIAQSVGRDPNAICLMPVTKMVAVAAIREAILCGCTTIGENRVQEIQAKQSDLKDLAHQTHLIGHLQTNKVKDVIMFVDCIQSLDSVRLAQKLQKCLEEVDKCLSVYIQINTSGEVSKSGIPPEDASSLIRQLLVFDRLRIDGLMTIGANTEDKDRIRTCFRRLVAIQTQLRDSFSHRAAFDVLSMGMSNDMAIAIEEGSTLLRIGRAIFGDRD